MREILTPAEMYRADAFAAAAGIGEDVLIENAGRAVAEEIVRRYGARPTVVLCGPGNNGRDGAVAARYLKSWGWPVAISQDISGAALIVDALYGAGLNRDFPKGLADRINGAGVPVVAIDVPSGLDGLTGRPRGACLRADLTITFFRKKPGHVLYPGRALCGEIVVADIGIPESALAEVKPRLWENEAPASLPRDAETHKYKRGHAIVWSGGEFSTGAARLAAHAAAKSGAGLVSIAGRQEALRVHAAHVSSVMLKPVGKAKDLDVLLADERVRAFCIGPAAGQTADTQRRVLAVLKHLQAVVLDADALTTFENDPALLFKAIKARKSATVLTPHEGEFMRLFKKAKLKAGNKIEAARAAAALSGAVVLYKGPDTVIAHPDGRAAVNTNGSVKLAIAGSGDVLSGIITGLLAQGRDGFAAACAAAWLHTDAANRLPMRNITAEQLIVAQS